MEWKEFKALGISLVPVGLEVRERSDTYFCTPKDAEILGWAGIDGIHYCTIPPFGEMIFSVNPMDVGDYVHPIARNLRDMLRLLLSCGDMGVLEQCYAWDEEQFKAFLQDCPITEEQQSVLEDVRAKLNITPMENAFGYIKGLQAEFDLSRIPYTEEYYDLDMNPAAPLPPQKWEVHFGSNFWSRGKVSAHAGKEIKIEKRFAWGDENWYVPSVYACGKGLVVDFCTEVAPERVRAFIDKWHPDEIDSQLTREERNQMNRENPLRVEFRPHIEVNARGLRHESGCSVSWIPASCLPEGVQLELEAKAVLAHYGLDEEKAWVFHRCAFLWATAKKPSVKTIRARLARMPEEIVGAHFTNPKVGEKISFVHPITGVEHTLTVQGYERQTISLRELAQKEYEFPTHCTYLSYTLEPDLPDRSLRIQDCADSDRPILRPRGEMEKETSAASAIGIIGGADGPTAIFAFGKSERKDGHVAVSSLHFEEQNEVEWRMTFYEKMVPDTDVTLLG